MTNTDVENVRHLLNLARTEIKNLRQQIKTLNAVHRKECDEIKDKLVNYQCPECKNRSEQPNQNAAGAAARSLDVPMREIGVISTSFPEKRGTPRQPGICSETVAKLTLNQETFTNPSHSIEGLEEFSHLWILFHFHRNDSTHIRAKVSPPRLNGARTGVFATRSPHRPSPIGLSLVKIDRIMGNTIYFSGVDMVDQTPVLDIKPYIPQYDNPSCVLSEIDRNSSQPDISSQATATHLDNLNVRTLDGEENNASRGILGAAAVANSNLANNLDELSFTRLNSRIGEREAPDGEEEETPSIMQTMPTANRVHIPTTPEGHIRVPSWIDQPPVTALSVTFKDRALVQLAQLGPEGEEKKRIISNVLREDPRSVYLRERWSSHCYVFRISELYVSCKFNDETHSVTVYQVFQNDGPENTEDMNE